MAQQLEVRTWPQALIHSGVPIRGLCALPFDSGAEVGSYWKRGLRAYETRRSNRISAQQVQSTQTSKIAGVEQIVPYTYGKHCQNHPSLLQIATLHGPIALLGLAALVYSDLVLEYQ